MSIAWKIASHECHYWVRSKLALSLLLCLFIFSTSSAFISSLQYTHLAQERAYQQDEANSILKDQPDRHPHRMVHYGHYVYEIPSPLARLDPGVSSFTGSSVFLEGHRQNTAAFMPARETGLLTRFGALTPAFVLQVLAPLFLILCGYSSIAREREQKTLTLLVSQGISPLSLLLGKVMALLIASTIALLPLLIPGIASALELPATLPALALLFGVYALYLAVWSALIIAVSSVSRSSSLALIGLLGLWISFTVVVPRAGVEMASIIKPAPTQTSTYLSISEAIIGDAHNAADPAFDQFRADVLAQYSVDTIEELPVNYRGLVSLRAEEADSAMYAEFMSARLAAHTQQSALLNAFALLSPTIALRDISMRISGTSLLDHHAFLQAAEAYRYAMIQNYNRLHAELVDYQDDVARSVNALNEQRTRVDAANWASLPPFEMPRLSLQTRLSEAGFSLSILLLWFVAGCGLLLLLRRRAVQ